MPEIREELPGEHAAIRELNHRAFGGEQESRIVDALRDNGALLLSLVAIQDEQLVGHIAYSPATIGGLAGVALGPMSVAPEHQRQGIGSKLVAEGSRRLKAAGWPFVVVLGHADFYPRFGFRRASEHGVRCQWTVPDEAFMLLVLDEAAMSGATGLARYRQEFST